MVHVSPIDVHSYEIKTAKTDFKVPVVNEVHLHSVYNPIKEATTLINKHADVLKAKTDVLIFGLGFGYHVVEAISFLKEHHGDDFRIIVIDPNNDVVNDCLKIHNFDPKNVIIYSGEQIESLYSDVNLVSFLIDKPAVIPHPASFNLYGDYFKSFLTYKAKKQTATICNNIQSEILREYIFTKSEEENLELMIDEQVQTKRHIDNDLDFLMLAFNHMTKDRNETPISGAL